MANKTKISFITTLLFTILFIIPITSYAEGENEGAENTSNEVDLLDLGSISGQVQSENLNIRDISSEIDILLYSGLTKDLYMTSNVDEDGLFNIQGLPYGEYILRVESSNGSIYYNNVYNIDEASSIEIEPDENIISGLIIKLDDGKMANNDVYTPTEEARTVVVKECEEKNEEKTYFEKNGLLFFSLVIISLLANIGLSFYLYRQVKK